MRRRLSTGRPSVHAADGSGFFADVRLYGRDGATGEDGNFVFQR